MYSDPIWKMVIPRRRGTLLIGLAFLVGFALCAAFILSTTRAASHIYTSIPLADRLRNLYLPLLGPFSWSGNTMGAWYGLIWSLFILAGIVFARNFMAVALAMTAAFTWPLFAIIEWGMRIS